MYREIRDTKGMSLPSPNLLYKKQTTLQPSPGVDANSMQFMKDFKNRKQGNIKGHLMMDEIK